MGNYTKFQMQKKYYEKICIIVNIAVNESNLMFLRPFELLEDPPPIPNTIALPYSYTMLNI